MVRGSNRFEPQIPQVFSAWVRRLPGEVSPKIAEIKSENVTGLSTWDVRPPAGERWRLLLAAITERARNLSGTNPTIELRIVHRKGTDDAILKSEKQTSSANFPINLQLGSSSDAPIILTNESYIRFQAEVTVGGSTDVDRFLSVQVI